MSILSRRISKVSLPILLFLALGFLSGCSREPKLPELVLPETDLASAALIPKPVRVVNKPAAFPLDHHTAIFTEMGRDAFTGVGLFLSQEIQKTQNLAIPVNPDSSTDLFRGIYLIQTPGMEQEQYELAISSDSILLRSATAEGAFRGVQTLRQLIPHISNDTLAEYPVWVIPGGTIQDEPTFEYRGGMLDVARHFFDISDVKKYLDIMAYYKMNYLHLHLTDDQGWRIEITSWPKLTEIGGQTEVGGEAGGYYTQEAYKELVAYAGDRYITIVPEVDMPGHTNAASVSYPFLNGNGKTPKPYTGMRVGFSTLDTRKDTVYQFIDDVVREISALTPGPYFHIGGDESHATPKAEYEYFIKRVVPIVRKYGKIPIGWDEVGTVSLDADVVAQYWQQDKANVARAAEQGMKILMSPAKKAYLDMSYDSISKFGLHWAAYIPVDSAYTWSPETYSSEIPRAAILGVEAPLWSETISTIAELEYLAFPRLLGYAELGWTPPAERSWEDYKMRLIRQTPYFKRLDIQFYPSQRVPWMEADSLLPWHNNRTK
ncbi:MAG: family 20 glycosylhydrolase [Robiginitalea sp.]|uniref:family 20 glycosylhydrolase n=1 Tax=Robiginitalea sp. TaxID=1902411 RepID=UPI003C77CE18